MNELDLVVAGASILAAVAGYHVGFVARVLSWIGFAGGLALAVLFVDNVAHAFDDQPPRTRLLAAVGFLLLTTTAGQIAGFALGASFRRALGSRLTGALRTGDSLAGAVVGVVGILAMLWLVIPGLANAPGWPARAVHGSAIARFVDRTGPEPPDAATALARLVGDESLPEVFSSLHSPKAGTPPVGGLDPAVAQRILPSVVKITGVACDRVLSGTGFLVARDLVVTNAHVVAGEKRTRFLTHDGRRIDASVLAFDGMRDLAILRAPGIGAPPLPRADASVDTRGALFGHPDGGALRETPVRIAQEIVAKGSDITRAESTIRQVYVLAARARPGDSGGPVVDRDGRVIGVLFARDAAQATTAYALTNEELDAVLAPVLANTSTLPTSTGRCLAG